MNKNKEQCLEELIQALEKNIDENSYQYQYIEINKEILKDIKSLLKGLDHDNNTILNFDIDYNEFLKGNSKLLSDVKEQLKKDHIKMIKSLLTDNFFAFCNNVWLQCELIITLLIEEYPKHNTKEIKKIYEQLSLIIYNRSLENFKDCVQKGNLKKLWMKNKITLCLLIIYQQKEKFVHSEEYIDLRSILIGTYNLRCLASHRSKEVRFEDRIKNIYATKEEQALIEKLYKEKSYDQIFATIKLFIFRASQWLPKEIKK